MKYTFFSISILSLILTACSNSGAGVEPDVEQGKISSSALSSHTVKSSGVHSVSEESVSSSGPRSSAIIGSSSVVASSSSFVPVHKDWCATEGNCGTFVDSRDNRTYKWTKIAGKQWMAEDLRFMQHPSATMGLFRYSSSSGAALNTDTVWAYVAEHAGTACPEDWRLPTVDDVSDLVTAAGGVNSGVNLRSQDQWAPYDTALHVDSFGFNGFPAPAHDYRFDSWGDDPTIIAQYWYDAVVWVEDNAQYQGVFLLQINENAVQFSRSASWLEKNRIRCVKKTPEVPKKVSPWCKTDGNCGAFTDSRDGQSYRWTKIKGLKWMSENLNYSGDDGQGNKVSRVGWCFGNGGSMDTTLHTDNAVCSRFGRLYAWNDVATVCPSGWRIPNSNDIDSLLAEEIGTTRLERARNLAYPTLGFASEGSVDGLGLSIEPTGFLTRKRFDDFGREGRFWLENQGDFGVQIWVSEFKIEYISQNPSTLASDYLLSVRCVN